MSDVSSPLVKFVGQVVKVQTMHQDNTIRVTIDLSEGETVIMAKLAECARFGTPLSVEVSRADVAPEAPRIGGRLKREQSTP